MVAGHSNVQAELVKNISVISVILRYGNQHSYRIYNYIQLVLFKKIFICKSMKTLKLYKLLSTQINLMKSKINIKYKLYGPCLL